MDFFHWFRGLDLPSMFASLSLPKTRTRSVTKPSVTLWWTYRCIAMILVWEATWKTFFVEILCCIKISIVTLAKHNNSLAVFDGLIIKWLRTRSKWFNQLVKSAFCYQNAHLFYRTYNSHTMLVKAEQPLGRHLNYDAIILPS